MTTNPNIEPRAKTIKFLEAKQMSSLSWLGFAEVLHHRAVHVARKNGLTLERTSLPVLAMKNSYYKV